MSGTASQFGGTSGFCMSSTVHLKEWVNTLRFNGAKDCCPGSMAASHQSRETQGCSEFAVPFPFTRPYNIPGRHFDEGSPHPTNQMFYLSRQALHHRPQPTPIKEQHRSPMREEPLPPQGNDEGQQNAGAGNSGGCTPGSGPGAGCTKKPRSRTKVRPFHVNNLYDRGTRALGKHLK